MTASALHGIAIAGLLGILTNCHPSTRSGRTPTWTNGLGMDMIRVETEDHALWVARHETRVRDYRTFVRATGRPWPRPAFRQGSDHPAVMVSWHDATAFCQWLSEKEHHPYRLPTDAEWSSLTQNSPSSLPRFPWGGRQPAPPPRAGNYCDAAFGRRFGRDYDAAWIPQYDDGWAATAPVGRFIPLPNGLCDLAGNVWEWTDSWIDPSHPRERSVRGGSWRTGNADRLQTAFRGPDPPDFRLDSVGFRIVSSRPPTLER
ncbi:MAG: SUMF1/EgtB/PvdO family nonheme iron enzyme [Verrucomicrobiales bacterium]|nr:SUMF1/EgtB/PvdO family nonheme iron enzyme [Verrucomicrobiales bacterium]